MSPIIELIGGAKAYGWGSVAELPPSFESIATISPASGSSSITFSNIPQTYQHLQVRFSYARLNSSSGSAGLTFNSDTGSNYIYHYLGGNGSNLDPNGNASYTAILVMPVSGGSTSPASYGSAIVDIYDYNSSSKKKTLRSFSGVDRNGTGWVYLGSGLWQNTNAITSIRIDFQGDTCAANCVFSLYGIKGAI